MSDPRLHVKILGSRGSAPTHQRNAIKVGGATPSILIKYNEITLLLDAGSGLSTTLKNLPDTLYLFFSHLHLDHIIGLPTFSYLFSARRHIHIFGPATPRFPKVEEALNALISPPFFPIAFWESAAKKSYYSLTGHHHITLSSSHSSPQIQELKPGAIPAPPQDPHTLHILSFRHLSHPKSSVTLYGIQSHEHKILYATDVEDAIDQDPQVAAFAQQCDILVHDAMYTDQEYYHDVHPTKLYGHTTIQAAAKTAKRLNVKKLLLFHHHPFASDQTLKNHLNEAKKIFPNTELAHALDSYYL